MSFADHVAARLGSPGAAGLHRYLVVDQAALHRVNVEKALQWTGPSHDLLHCRTPRWDETASPVLIAAPQSGLTARQLGAWRAFASRWRYANALTYLEGFEGPHEMPLQLAERTRATLPDQMAVVLRWYDNRILAVLLKVLSAAQRETLLRNISHCAFSDRRGSLLLAEATQSMQAQVPIRLSRDQEASLIESCEPDALIDLLLDQGQVSLMEMLPPDQFDRIHALWQMARGYGIEQSPDQAAFCQLGLECGVDFHVQQPWADVARYAANNGGRFVMALERFEVQAT